MIVTCPACAARYRVADQEFAGAAGRTVRCANCGHLWYEARGPKTRLGGEPFDAALANPAAPDRDPGASAPPMLSFGPDPDPAGAPSRTRSGRGAALWLTAVAMLVVAGVTAAVFSHHASAPDRAAPLASVAPTGQARVPFALGLVIRKVAPSRSDGELVIAGEIANLGDAARKVPRLRLALQDSADKELRSEIVDPPKARLEPGESVHFHTAIADPPDNATGVVVTFASP